MSWRTRDRLSKHLPRAIKHTRRQITRLAHYRTERRTHEHLRLLFNNGEQAIPGQLNGQFFQD